MTNLVVVSKFFNFLGVYRSNLINSLFPKAVVKSSEKNARSSTAAFSR